MPEQDYDYSYDENDAYLYSGTDVLVNNFGIKDRKELSEIERAITGARIAEIDIHPILGCFDLDHLCAIHKALFEGVYPWAGKIRTRGFISKGNSLFCAPEFIVSYSDDLLGKLNEDGYLKELCREDFIKKMAFYCAEINALHPFREGNGRAQRVFANQLARSAGWELRLYTIDPNELCEAYIESMHVSTDHLEQLLDVAVRKR